MRTILICTTPTDGNLWAEAHGYATRDLRMVTPTHPHGARGFSTEAIYATLAARSHPAFDDLVAETTPALSTRPAHDRVEPAAPAQRSTVRIQVLELPTKVVGDVVETPFALVLDGLNGPLPNGIRECKEMIGAKAILGFQDRVEVGSRLTPDA